MGETLETEQSAEESDPSVDEDDNSIPHGIVLPVISKTDVEAELIEEYNTLTAGAVQLSIYTDNIQALRKHLDAAQAETLALKHRLHRLTADLTLLNKTAEVTDEITHNQCRATSMSAMLCQHTGKLAMLVQEQKSYRHMKARTEAQLTHYKSRHKILTRQLHRVNERLATSTQLKKQSWLEYDVVRRKLQRTQDSLHAIQDHQLTLLKERTFDAEEIRGTVDSEVERFVRKKNVHSQKAAFYEQLREKAVDIITQKSQRMQAKQARFNDANQKAREIARATDTFGSVELSDVFGKIGRTNSNASTLFMNIQHLLDEKCEKEGVLAQKRERLAAQQSTVLPPVGRSLASLVQQYAEEHSRSLAHVVSLRRGAKARLAQGSQLVRKVVDGLYHIQTTVVWIDPGELFGPQCSAQVFCDERGTAQLDQLYILLAHLPHQLAVAQAVTRSRHHWIVENAKGGRGRRSIDTQTPVKKDRQRGRGKHNTILEGRQVFRRHFVCVGDNDGTAIASRVTKASKAQALAEDLATDFHRLESEGMASQTSGVAGATHDIEQDRRNFDLLFAVSSDSDHEDEARLMRAQRNHFKRALPKLPTTHKRSRSLQPAQSVYETKSQWESRIQAGLNVFDKSLQTLTSKTRRMNLKPQRVLDLDTEFQKVEYQLQRLKDDPTSTTKSTINSQTLTTDNTLDRKSVGKSASMTHLHKATGRRARSLTMRQSTLASVGKSVVVGHKRSRPRLLP